VVETSVDGVGEGVNEVGDLVNGVGEGVNEVVDRVREVGSSVDEVVDLVRGMGELVDEVVDRVRGVGQPVDEVVDRVRGVGEGVGEVGILVGEVGEPADVTDDFVHGTVDLVHGMSGFASWSQVRTSRGACIVRSYRRLLAMMRFRSGYLASIFVALGVLGCSSEDYPGKSCPLVPNPYGTFEFDAGGKHVKVEDGEASLWDASAGEWTFLEKTYDPGFFAENYEVDADCSIYRKDPATGARYPVRRKHADDFEGADKVVDLLGPQRGWTDFVLQSPLAPTVEEYVKLRACIIAGTCDFRDNRLDLDPVNHHGGMRALRALSVPPSANMVTAKASIETSLMHFVRGDDVWFSGWFNVAEGRPFTLFDLESDWLNNAPGPRVMIGDDGGLLIELKWADKPTYRQPAGSVTPFPLGQWVHVEVHYVLSDGDSGVTEVWQDGVNLISAQGRNLPLPNTILDSFELGISANNHPDGPTVLLVDDVFLGTQRPE
jgi:hypothetical protein